MAFFTASLISPKIGAAAGAGAASKLHKSNKPRYVSKAERAKLEAEEAAQVTDEGETQSPE